MGNKKPKDASMIDEGQTNQVVDSPPDAGGPPKKCQWCWCKSIGVIGTIFRILLIVLNFVIVLAGAAVFAVGMVLRFSSVLSSVYTTLANDNVSFLVNYIYYLFYLIMGIGVVISLYGLFGVLATVLGNRVILVIFIITFILIMIVHGAVLITVISTTAYLVSYIQTIFNSFWTPVCNTIQSTNLTAIYASATAYQNFTSVCQSTYGVFASAISCCDFNTTNLTTACCPSSYTATCPNAVVSIIEYYTSLFLDMPLGIIVGFEVVTIFCSIFVLIKIWIYKNRAKKARMMGVGAGGMSPCGAPPGKGGRKGKNKVSPGNMDVSPGNMGGQDDQFEKVPPY